MGWVVLLASPTLGYAWLVLPMTLGGIGFAIAIPAVTKAVVGAVAPGDIGKASGTYSTVRQLGGVFGIAIAAAAFTAAGGYTSPAAFSAGFTRAGAAVTLMSLFGTLASLALPGRPPASAVSDRRDPDPGLHPHLRAHIGRPPATRP